MDIFSGGEIHDGVGTPAGGPDHLLDFFIDGRGDGRVSDVGIDLHQHKLDMGKKFGLTHGILAGSDDLSEDIKSFIGDLADIVIETTGNSRVIEQAYDLTHPDGKTILVGVPNKGDNVSIYTLPLHFNKVLTGSHGGDSVPDIEIPRYIRLIKSEKMTLDGLITHEFSLDEINDALDLFRSGEAGRIIINML